MLGQGSHGSLVHGVRPQENLAGRHGAQQLVGRARADPPQAHTGNAPPVTLQRNRCVSKKLFLIVYSCINSWLIHAWCAHGDTHVGTHRTSHPSSSCTLSCHTKIKISIVSVTFSYFATIFICHANHDEYMHDALRIVIMIALSRIVYSVHESVEFCFASCPHRVTHGDTQEGLLPVSGSGAGAGAGAGAAANVSWDRTDRDRRFFTSSAFTLRSASTWPSSCSPSTSA